MRGDREEVHDPGADGPVRERELVHGLEAHDLEAHGQEVHGQGEEADSLALADGRNLSLGEAAVEADRSLRTGPGDPCRARGGDGAAGWGLGEGE